MDDPFEGYSPVKNLQEEITAKKQESNQREQLFSDANTADPETQVQRNYESYRKLSLVNCWSMRKEDSLPMWKSYIPDGDGVAVSTTFGKLKSSINNDSNIAYHAGKVGYFNYFDDSKDSNNFFRYIMSKPKQYEYEREMRIFVWWPHSGEVSLDNRIIAPIGTKLNVDLDILIDDVCVSPFGPSWLTPEYWNDILEKYEIDATAEMSKLAMDPDDVLNQ
jgi:hypothetical protein